MATVSFWADQNIFIQNLSGSGLGFFGSTFGNSVEVGEYQQTTYITDGNGTNEGPVGNNIKYTHAASGQVNSETESWALNTIPNRLATLNIRFTHTSSVKTQNPQLRIYDRSSINNNPSGVTTKVAELIHPSYGQADAAGSGDTSWQTPVGSSVIMTLTASSPGHSGEAPNGWSETTDTRHDWYFAISASPDSIGSKTLYGLYFECEYL